MSRGNTTNSIKLRYNLIITFVYIIGIVLLFQLFNLQIIHGQEYREKSNTRLTRESVLEAARGPIVDRTGNKIATVQEGYNLEIYQTKIDTKTLNNTLLHVAQLLESNGDSYIDEFPIKTDPIEFTASEDYIKRWKKQNNLDENMTAEECFKKFKEKYKIENDSPEDARKIMTLRYQISSLGYSTTKPAPIANNISKLSAVQIGEQGLKFPRSECNKFAYTFIYKRETGITCTWICRENR